MRRTAVVYTVFMTVFLWLIAWTLDRGKRLEPARAAATAAAAPATAAPATHGSAPRSPLARLLVQLVVVVVLARALGLVSTKVGQPSVIGEVVAGILLGPSLLGFLWPAASAFLFPASSLDTLQHLAEVGVLLFMFTVGMELDVEHLSGRAHGALVVSHASILVPYFLGVALSLFLYPTDAPAGVPFLSFALFMGIAMSITAFPVLARILEERGLARTPLGAMAITCAAVDDVTAWSLLALVVAIVRANGLGAAAGTLLLTGAFAVLMVRFVGPLFSRALAGRRDASPSRTTIAAVLALVLASALATEVIGVHALFGAFLAGVVMPKETRFRAALAERTEELASVLLLPLFFAFTGLRTRIDLLDAHGWLLCLAVVLVATLGKLGGTFVAARLSGMPTADAFALGALMNTRGLMELIALNVGYELGILSPRVFAMMVVMALATTFATGPLLAWGERLRKAPSVPGAATLVS